MYTFTDYMTFIKGVEYLIAVAFLAAFLVIWQLMTQEKKTLTIPFIFLALVFGVLIVVVITPHTTVEAQVITADLMKVNETTYLSNVKGYASFPHATHIETIGKCDTCHHHSKDQVLSCRECHDEPFNTTDMEKPGLKAAVHERCMQCHENDFREGPNSCTKCHHTENTREPVFTGPNRPHSLVWKNCEECHTKGVPVRPGEEETKVVYHENCLTCHKKSIARAPQIPADHKERTNSVCEDCHNFGGNTT